MSVTLSSKETFEVVMKEELTNLLREYLEGMVDLEAINSWLARNIWFAEEGNESDFLHDIAGELFYVMDRTADENQFRASLAEFFQPTTMVSVIEDSETVHAVASTSGEDITHLLSMDYRHSAAVYRVAWNPS